MAAALAAGALKVFRGDHYPSDLAFGFLIGLAAEGLTSPLFRAANGGTRSAGKAFTPRYRQHEVRHGQEVEEQISEAHCRS